MGYLDFMKIESCTLLLGNEKELSIVPSSPVCMESASTASSMQPPDILPPKLVPTFRLDAKTKNHVLLKFPATRSDSSPTRRYSMFKKKKNCETKWYYQKCCVPPHPGKCDTRYHTLQSVLTHLQKVCTKLQIPVCHSLWAECFWILLLNESIESILTFKNPGLGN
jgi:hypothetical protein